MGVHIRGGKTWWGEERKGNAKRRREDKAYDGPRSRRENPRRGGDRKGKAKRRRGDKGPRSRREKNR